MSNYEMIEILRDALYKFRFESDGVSPRVRRMAIKEVRDDIRYLRSEMNRAHYRKDSEQLDNCDLFPILRYDE